jgi:hypothetical protein
MTGLASRCLDAAPEGWAALVNDDPGAGPAHRPELARAVAQVMPGTWPVFIAVERDGALVGGCIAMVERRGAFQWLHAMPWGLPGSPLALPGLHAEVDMACGRALAGLKRELRTVGGGWVPLRGEGGPVREEALALIGGTTKVLESWRIDVAPDGLEAAWARVDRKTRKEIRRARESGLVFAEEPGEVGAAHALHVSQGRAWRGHNAMPLDLARRLVAAGGAAPVARVFTLRDRGEIVAAVLGLDHPREILPWWSGLHPAVRNRHASGLLLWSVVEWAAEHGRERVNLGGCAGLGPVKAFKSSLGARPVPYASRWFDDADASWPGRLASRLQRTRRRFTGREPR